MSTIRILFVGASGYIGGTVLNQLLASTTPALKSASITALVRTQSQAAAFNSHPQIQTTLFSGLEDTAFLHRLASEHDVVINCAISYNVSAAKAFMEGLSTRHPSGPNPPKRPIYVHTSGTSSIAVGTTALTKDAASHLPAAYSDAHDDIYSLLQRLEAETPYIQRTTDLAVIATSKAANVGCYIIMPPLIYGIGTGNCNRLSVQEPATIGKALATGGEYTPVIAPGIGSHNHVHVEDLAEVYELLLCRALSDDGAANLPVGTKGIYFAETGQHTWLEISKGVAKAGVELGRLKTEEVREVTAEEWSEGGSGSKTLPNDPEIIAHSMGSHGLGRAVLAREVLGWRPKRGQEAWKGHFVEEFRAVVAELGK